MIKPTWLKVGKTVKIGLLISCLALGLYSLGFLPQSQLSFAKKKPLSRVDSMFQEMQILPGKSQAQDMSFIAEKYIKIDSSKEDVLSFFKQSKYKLKISEYSPKDSTDLKMGIILDRNNWICSNQYFVSLTLQSNLVKEIHARFGSACL